MQWLCSLRGGQVETAFAAGRWARPRSRRIHFVSVERPSDDATLCDENWSSCRWRARVHKLSFRLSRARSLTPPVHNFESPRFFTPPPSNNNASLRNALACWGAG